MSTFKKPGDVLTFTAPSGGVTVGVPLLIGSLLVVPKGTAAEDAEFEGMITGEHYLPKTTGATWSEGDKVYWKVSTSKFTKTSSDGQLAGVASRDAGSSDAYGYVRLNGTAPTSAEGPQANIPALTDNSGGATADGTIGVITVPTALTGAGSGTANGALEAEGTLSTAGGNTYTDAAVNAVLSKIENNIMELAASQTANITAITAARDAVKELATKVNAIIASMVAHGDIDAP